MADVKVLVGEVDGEEMDVPVERILHATDVTIQIPGVSSTKVQSAIAEIKDGDVAIRVADEEVNTIAEGKQRLVFGEYFVFGHLQVFGHLVVI